MKLIIDDYTEPMRLDAYLANYLHEFSRSKIQTEIKKENITVNGTNVKPSYLVKEGDVVLINIAENSVNILPENIPLDIVWQDENMAVINKPSGMLTHPTSQELSGTLVNALLFLYGNNLSDVNGELRRGILHRLDRNTSGLLMIAKNNAAHEFLAQKMKEHVFVKKYLAFVKGVIEKSEFTIVSPIGRNPKQPQKMTITESGKECLSKIKVLKRYKDATLVEVELITGRTHQIRVHMASIGHPVYNDTLYGFGKMKIKTDEQVLQSYKLTFQKPFTEEFITLEIPMDSKLVKVQKALE